MTHKTKGIVLKTVKYGETSVIVSAYTELFGLQSYIVKGVRKDTKKSQSKQNYFQPGAILSMEVYHNELKNLQFIKEYQWSELYERIFFDVVRNAIATYMLEVLQKSLKQPENNPDLFYFIENVLTTLDKCSNPLAANLPLYFMVQLGRELGFELQGKYSNEMHTLDLQEGSFCTGIPHHPYYTDGVIAEHISSVNAVKNYEALENLKLNREVRRQLLNVLQTYITLHVQDFGEMRSAAVLQDVLE